MDRRHLVRLLAIGRIAIGAALVLTPRRAGRGWIGDGVDDAGTRIAVRALGIRDLVLGLGTYRALEHDGDARGWVQLGAICDVVDAAATAATPSRLATPGGLTSLAVASGAAAVGLSSLDALEA